MKPEELKQELNQGMTRPVYLLYGDEPYLIQQYCRQITDLIITEDSFRDFNYYRTDKIEQEKIEQFLQTPPVFAEKKLLLFKDTGVFKNPKAADKDFLQTILADVPDYACIVFAEQTIDKKQKKLLALAETVECNQMTEAQLKTWITILVQRQKKKITVKTIEHLISCCGSAMFHLEHEINKLCSCTEEDVITTEQIDKIVVKSVENRIFDLSNAVLNQQNKTAFSILTDLKILRESPIKIIGFLSKSFCDIYKIKQCPNPTPQGTGLHPYVVKLHTATARKLSAQTLTSLISLAAECDTALKSSAVTDWTVLETCIAACLDVSKGASL
ncbi:MAG: DNA polymerase III subunit delta [Ruminococcaceae bacterium]|nr:DNA polymerase III subunit delta [Oscillospiraceae bacterium]